MKYAIDYGGVLQTHEWVREMAKALLAAGHEVYCITAVPNHWKGTGRREKEVADLGIPFTGVHLTYHDTVDGSDHVVTQEQAYQAGKEKAKVMKQLGVEVLFDDVPPIIVAVREEGLIGVHIA